MLPATTSAYHPATVEHAGHTRATGAPKLSYRRTSLQLATGKAAGRGKSRAILQPGGPPRILFSGTPSWEVVSADDLRIGARFVLGGARTLHAALRDAAQTIDRVHSTFMTCPAGRIDLGATPSQGLDRSGSDPVERDVLGRI